MLSDPKNAQQIPKGINKNYKSFGKHILKMPEKVSEKAEAYLGLVKLVVMTNVFFNYHQRKIEIKLLICVK